MKMLLTRCEPKKRKISVASPACILSNPDTDREPDCKAVWRLRKHSEHLAAHITINSLTVQCTMWFIFCVVRCKYSSICILYLCTFHDQLTHSVYKAILLAVIPVQWYCELCSSKAFVIVTDKFQCHSAVVLYAISTKAIIQAENDFYSDLTK